MRSSAFRVQRHCNCPRYIHRYRFEETSEYVPDVDHEPPIPEWKFLPELNAYLAADDPARGQPPPGRAGT